MPDIKNKELSISYHPQSIESLRQGLVRYAQLVQRKDAFSERFFQVTFSVENDEEYTLGSLADDPICVKIFSFFTRETSFQPDSLVLNGMSGELIFFLRALQYPQLENELKKAAMAIRTVSRQLNDFDEMWSTEEETMGLFSLFALSLKYPQYTYIFAGYITSGLDLHYTRPSEDVLKYVVSHHGYSHHMLKAFCYCDNDQARFRMFDVDKLNLNTEYEPYYTNDFEKNNQHNQKRLIDIFREQPEEFEVFKQMLKQRFAEQEYIQLWHNSFSDYDERYHDGDPVATIINTVAMVGHVDEFYEFEDIANEMAGTCFIDKTLYETICEVRQVVEEYIGHEVVQPIHIDYEPRNWITADSNNWQLFIYEQFRNGKDIWNYIVTGNNPEVLDSIKATDVGHLANEKNYRLSEDLAPFLAGYEDDRGYWFFDSMFITIAEWSGVEIKEKNLAESEERFYLFRLLDVIHRWNGKKSFTPLLFHKAVYEIELLSFVEFCHRYNGDWKSLLHYYVDSAGFDYIHGEKKKVTVSFYQVLSEKRNEIKKLIKEKQFFSENEISTLLSICAVIAYFDKDKNINDEITQWALNNLNLHLKNQIYQGLAQNSAFLCASKQVPLAHKKLNEEEKNQLNYEWNDIEKYLNGEHDDVEKVIVNFDKNLYFDETDMIWYEKQKHYDYLSERNYFKTVYAAYVISLYQSSPIQCFSERFVTLWLRLAPIKTGYILADFCGSESGDMYLIYKHDVAFVEQLKGMSEVGKVAFAVERLLMIANSAEDEFHTLSMELFSRYKKEKSLPKDQQVLSLALELLWPSSQQFFMVKLHEFNSELTGDYFNTFLAKALKSVVEISISKYRELTSEYDDEIDIVYQYFLLKKPASSQDVNRCLEVLKKYHIEKFAPTYGLLDFRSLFLHLSNEVQDNLLRIYVHFSDIQLSEIVGEYYESDQETEDVQIYICQRSIILGIDKIKLLQFIIDENWKKCLQLFLDHDEIINLASDLSDADLYGLLIKLAKENGYDDVILSFKNKDNILIKNLIADVKKGIYGKNDSSCIKIVNFGLYENGAKITDDENVKDETLPWSVHAKKSQLIIANKGGYLGIEVRCVKDDEIVYMSNPVPVKARIHHPVIKGAKYSDIPLTSNYEDDIWICNIGSRGGVYRFDVLDEYDNLLDSKTFHVVTEKHYLDDSMVPYYDDDTEQEYMGALNIEANELDIVDVFSNCQTLGLSNKLSSNILNVYRYFQGEKLTFLELRLNSNDVINWHRAPHNIRIVLEKFIKGKKILIGANSSISTLLSQQSIWLDDVNEDTPLKIFKPDMNKGTNALAMYIKEQGISILFGYDKYEQPCRILFIPRKLGFFSRAYLSLINYLSEKIIKKQGKPDVL